MSASAHYARRLDPQPGPYRRRHRTGNGFYKCTRMFVLVLLSLWILTSSPGNLFGTGRRGGAHSAQSTFRLLVAAEEYSNTCNGRQDPRPGAIYSAVGHLNYGVGVDLRADMSIPGACEVNLPINVRCCNTKGQLARGVLVWVPRAHAIRSVGV